MKYRRPAFAPRNTPLNKAWRAALAEFRNGLVARRLCRYEDRDKKRFYPQYARPSVSAEGYVRISEVWAYLHLCARRGDPFTARAIARVLTQRLKA